MADTRERTIHTNGVDLHVVEAGEPGAPVVLLAHGFPELSYSWRHQIGPLADAGYHVLAPDQRGYGRSSRPDDIAAYDIVHLSDDLLGVLDDVGAEQATIVGHDWGSMLVWTHAQMHPDRTRAVVGMSVPFQPRGRHSLVTLLRRAMGDNFFYILYFQEPGVADADLNADPERTMRRMLCGLTRRPDEDDAMAAARMFAPGPEGFIERLPEPDGLPDWLSQAELDHYVAEFRRTGFTGGINWYRNFDRNHELTPHLDGVPVTMPSLFIGGAQDPVLVMSPAGGADKHLLDHRGNVVIDGAGHWVQQEAPAEVNDALLSFLADVH